MKKLRCTSCNGELELDDKKEYATCKYCNTKYKLNDDLTINIKLDEDTKKAIKKTAKVGRGILAISTVPFFIVSFIIVCIIVVSVIFGIGEVKKQQVNNFNFAFTYKAGSQNIYFIKDTLDDVNSSNQKNKRKITVVFHDIETQDYNEINEVKKRLANYEYIVRFEYDKKGYIEKMVITEM